MNSSRRLLTPDELAAALPGLAGAGWTSDGASLARDFRFPSFAAAIAWMVQVSFLAEKLDHHPEWTNSWRRVSVRLTTHSAAGLTALDVELARGMAVLAGPDA